MAKKYKSRTSRRSRSKRGGRGLLEYAPYPSNESGSWTTSPPPGTAAAVASSFKSFLSGFSQGSPSQNAGALNEFALKGNGQRGGGHSKRIRKSKNGKTSKKIAPKSFDDSNTREQQMAQGLTQAQAQAQAAAMQQAQTQSGGMFASFGALLKEALVPLGLLAAQQTYAKSYGKRTRKNRK
jgi:hypothetical protein